MSAPVPGTALPWAWASEDHSTLILGGADDYITHCVMWVSPCEACQDRSETKQWKWGACTTPSEQDAAYIAHACNNFPALLDALQWALPALEDIAENNDIDPISVCDPEERLCCHTCEQSGCLSAKLQRVRQAIASATGEA